MNVHPTKKEVHFLYEDRVVEGIISAFQSVLENANSSRTFYTQVLLPGASKPNEQGNYSKDDLQGTHINLWQKKDQTSLSRDHRRHHHQIQWPNTNMFEQTVK